jgi:hypothetical protein
MSAEKPIDNDAAARQPAVERGVYRVAVQTVYLQDPILDVRVLTLIGTLGGLGTLWLDRNPCHVNEFGDRTECTQGPPEDREVILVRRLISDPLGRQLYAIENNGLSNPLDLVVPANGVEPFRLVYHDRGAHTPRPITLERLLPGGREDGRGEYGIERCAARYAAQQLPDYMVTIFAFGTHPTSGYRVFFSQLPYPVFPPQFELLHVKPSSPTSQVVTPFVKSTAFDAHSAIRELTVHDVGGEHIVPVEQVPGPHEFSSHE